MRTVARSSFAAMRSASCFAQAVGDGGEVGVMRAHHDGHAELRRLERIVAARRNQAAADERDAGQRIDRGQFANGVEQDDLAGTERARPALRLPAPNACTQSCRTSPSRAATAPKRSGCRGARTMAELRIGWKSMRPRIKERGFFALERAAGDNEPQTGGDALSSAWLQLPRAARTSNFRLPATETQSGRQPSASRRSASVWLCASTRLRRDKQRTPKQRSMR